MRAGKQAAKTRARPLGARIIVRDQIVTLEFNFLSQVRPRFGQVSLMADRAMSIFAPPPQLPVGQLASWPVS